MTVIDPSNFAPADAHRSLMARLNAFRRQVKMRLLLEGFARLVLSTLGLAIATFLLDRTFRLSLIARISMVVGAAATLLIVVWRFVIQPLRLKLDPLTLASALDATSKGNSPELTPHIAGVLELPDLLSRRAPPSAAMVEWAVQRSHEALSSIEFGERFDDRRRNIGASAIVGSIVLALLLALTAPNVTRLWAKRLFMGSNQQWPQKTYLQVAGLDGNIIVVPRGEPFVLRASARAGSVVPKNVYVRFRETGASRVDASLTAFGTNDFRYDFSAINSMVEVELWGGDDVFEPFFLRPADRPKIVDLKLISQHPTETQPTTHLFTGSDADLSFLPKTQLQLQFTANTPIAQARLISSTTQPSASSLRQIDDEHFAIDWTHDANVQLQIELTSKDASLASVPTSVSIGLKKDQPPRLTLAYSGVRTRVTPQAKIPLTIDARDDYGIAKTALSVKSETPDPANPALFKPEITSTDLYGPVIPPTQTQVQPAYTLELSPLKLPPGGLVTLSALATDDCYTGAQTTQSRLVTFRIVPPEELFREILLRQQSERAKFRKQIDEAKSIRELLTTLSTAEAASQAARRHRAMQRESNRIAMALSESLTEMRLNALSNEDAYALMQKNILTPLKDLNEELLNPQKDALDTLKPEDSKTLTDSQDREDRIAVRMEEIMKQMSQWDSFVDVLNQLNEIIRLQDQAQQNTAQLKKEQTEGIFEK